MESSSDDRKESVDSQRGVEDDDYITGGGDEIHVGGENEVEEHSGDGKALVLFEGETIQEPYVGMEFESAEDARSFYNSYARRVGFGVRVNYSHRSRRDRSMIAQQYVCVKEGFRKNKEGTRKRHRASTRVGCNATMIVKKLSSGKWVVKSFEKDHNHPLVSPNEVQFLRSHKDVFKGMNTPAEPAVHTSRSVSLSSTQSDSMNTPTSNMNKPAVHTSKNVSLLRTQSDVGNIPSTDMNKPALHMSKNVSLLSTQSGGGTNARFLEQDCKNYVACDQQKNVVKGDAQVVLDYLNQMQNENPSFFYAIQLDKEDCVTNVFWVDAMSRMAYNYFGDVVIFDTAYLMNKYRTPFVPFIGVNHHGQFVLFGCALLVDGTKSSFVWLFKTWLAAISGRHPVSIITDQDIEIQSAVAEVFPRTHHRFCMSHIQRKLTDKLGHVCLAYKNFKEEFQKCIYQSKTIEEFESSWGLLLDTFSVRNNDWLQLIYQDRRYWAPVYLKGTFFADIFTNKRSEIVNTLLNGYMNVKTNPEEFFMLYNNALDSQYYKEVRADFDTMYTAPNLKTSSPMEKQVASLYTREIFKKFQIELFESFGYLANRIAKEGAVFTYLVAKFGEETKLHTVTFNVSEVRGNCSCHMFESTGILCRHVLNVFKVTNIFMLPSHYILKRWTKNAKSEVVLDEHGVEVQGNSRTSMILRYNDLCHRSSKFSDEGARSFESYKVAVRALQQAFKEVVGLNDSVTSLTHLVAHASGSGYHHDKERAEQGIAAPTSQCSTQDNLTSG